jgi:hypothetical protein
MNSTPIDTRNLAQDQGLSDAQLQELAQQSQGIDINPIEEQPLVDEKQFLVSNRQKQKDTKWRFTTVALIASFAIFALVLVISLYGKISGGGSVSQDKPTKKTYSSAQAKIVREDRLKAEVAMSDQDGDLKPEPKLVVEEKTKPQPTAQPTIPQPVAVQTEVKEVEKVEVDPLEEWARLANLGSAVGDREVAMANLGNSDLVATNAISSSDQSLSRYTSTTEVEQPRSIQEVSTAKIETTDNTATQPSEKDNLNLDKTITRGEVAKVASVSIGKNIIESEQAENQPEQFGLDSPAVTRLLSEDKPADTYLEKKRKQFEKEDRLRQLSSMGVAPSLELASVKNIDNIIQRPTPQDSEEQAGSEILPTIPADENQAESISYKDISSRPAPLDSEEQAGSEILPIPADENQAESISDIPVNNDYPDTQSQITSAIADSDATTATNNSKQVPLGATSLGEVSSSIIWSEGIDPGQSRGVINLTEPLLASDGSIALEANSSLIVEVEDVNTSGLTYLNVVAVSYENSQGILKQELLPPGAIVIRGEDNGPLVSEQTIDPGGTVLGQDVLIGLLGAGAKGFEELNQPDEDTTISDDLVVRTSSDRDPSLLNGAAEGVFSTTKERLEERSDQIIERELALLPIYHLEAGEEVTIFVNSFLEINP